MTVTGNQAVNLLWSHFFDPKSPLRLKESEVTFLKLEVVYQFNSIETELKKKLFTDDLDELIDHLRNNPCKSMFK